MTLNGGGVFMTSTVKLIFFYFFTVSEEKSKESCWPTVGEIKFQHVSLRYEKNQDPVVSDISFTIQPGEKVIFFVDNSWLCLIC